MDVRNAAEVYLENLVDDVSYYELDSIFYDEYTYINAVVFVHKVKGLDTNDIVYLGIDNDLNLLLFSMPRPYTFQEMENIAIDQEKIKQEAIGIYSREYNDFIDAKAAGLSLGTDDNETIGYQVEVESTRMLDGEKISEWDVVFIPFK